MTEWAKNKDYPRQRGRCDFCHHRDEVKLSFDRVRWICVNPHACFLRWCKSRLGENGAS